MCTAMYGLLPSLIEVMPRQGAEVLGHPHIIVPCDIQVQFGSVDCIVPYAQLLSTCTCDSDIRHLCSGYTSVCIEGMSVW